MCVIGDDDEEAGGGKEKIERGGKEASEGRERGRVEKDIETSKFEKIRRFGILKIFMGPNFCTCQSFNGSMH